MACWRALAAGITAVDGEIAILLAAATGMLTLLPGVATARAAMFASFSLPVAYQLVRTWSG